jgi:hypothetical protein
VHQADYGWATGIENSQPKMASNLFHVTDQSVRLNKFSDRL